MGKKSDSKSNSPTLLPIDTYRRQLGKFIFNH